MDVANFMRKKGTDLERHHRRQKREARMDSVHNLRLVSLLSELFGYVRNDILNNARRCPAVCNILLPSTDSLEVSKGLPVIGISH